MHRMTEIFLGNFSFSMIKFVNLSTTFFIQLFFHKNAFFNVFLFLGSMFFYIYGTSYARFQTRMPESHVRIACKNSALSIIPEVSLPEFGLNTSYYNLEYVDYVCRCTNYMVKSILKGSKRPFLTDL